MSKTALTLEDLDSATIERDIAALRAETQMLEGWGDRVVGPASWLTDPDNQSASAPYRTPGTSYTNISDRRDETFLPWYRHEHDLKYMRAESRALAAFVAVSIGAIESLGNYIFGQGFDVRAEPTDESAGNLAATADALLAELWADNDWHEQLSREMHDRSREDGEALIQLTDVDGSVRLDIVEPDELTEPANKHELARWLNMHPEMCRWDYGVHTAYNPTLKRDDANRPLGYHLVFDPSGSEWDYVPTSHLVHVKRNVPRRAKRGVSDYEPIKADISNVEKLRNNLTIGAAIQSAIALIREHAQGTTSSQAAGNVVERAARTVDRATKGGGTRQVNVERLRAGSIFDISAGKKYHAGPLGQLRSAVFVDVAQFVVRLIGVRWNMPEYMISGDASNANYSSTLVSESPFVKARENDQTFYKGVYRRLAWRALAIYHAAGRLGRGMSWSDVRAALVVTVDAPEVATRDRLAQAQVDQIYVGMGVQSKRTTATNAGLDYDEQTADIADEPQQPGAAPGAEAAIAESRFFYP